MQSAATYLLPLLAILSVSGHVAEELRSGDDEVYQEDAGPRALKTDSVLMGIAKSLIGGKKGAAGGQKQYCIDRDVYQRSARGFCSMSSLTTLSSPCKFFKMANGFCDLPDILSLSLNMSNLVLMLVLRGLIWGVSYVQNGGGKEARHDGGVQSSAADLFTETDAMLFFGYLMADESGSYDCLSRVACEQPSRAAGYLSSAEIVWRTLGFFDDVVSLDPKYEETLIRLQEAIEDGRANRDCQSKYKCYGPTAGERFNPT